MKLRTLLIFTLVYVMIAALPAKAQEISQTQPVNLSRSGSTSAPALTIDNEGSIHVIWLDDFSGILYSFLQEDVWSEPVTVDFPFEETIPSLVQSEEGVTLAIWINKDEDMWFSSVPSTEFGQATAWSSPQLLDGSVLSFDVAADDQGGIHLVYIKSVQSDLGPPGVYYKIKRSPASGWQESENLYASRYFRAAGAEDVNVQIGVVSRTEAPEIYVVWDDRPVKTVFFSSSIDAGVTWEPPVEIASPQILGSSTTPYNIRMHASDDHVLLVYQNGQPGLSCSQASIFSHDNGRTWSAHHQMLVDIAGCARENGFFAFGDHMPVLWTNIQDQIYFSAWDGERWSQPQNFTKSVMFEDPNSRILITLGNPQFKVAKDRLIYTIGSDTQRGDVWWNPVVLDDPKGWFRFGESWNPLEVVTSGAKPVQSLVLTSDQGNQIHAFWAQISGELRSTPDAAIYYSRWENGRLWSFPISIETSDEMVSDQPSVTTIPSGHLALVWRGGENGSIYYRQSPSNLAVLSSSWTDPVLISSLGQQADSPEIRVDQAGKLYVVYAVPINEARGIFLVTSDDGGQNWTEPDQIMDSQANGYAWVDDPHLAISENGALHLIWANYQLVSGQPQPVSLFYSRSSDGGGTWTAPETVSNQFFGWSSLEAGTNGAVHRIWQDVQGVSLEIWHEFSVDGGNTWQRAKLLSVFGTKIGSPALTKDLAGRLHLFQIVEVEGSQFTLHHVIWDGNSWTNRDKKDLNIDSLVSFGSPAAIVSPDGEVGVLIPATVENSLSAETDMQLIFTHVSLGDLPPVGTPGEPSAVPTATMSPQPAPSVTPETALPTRTAEMQPTRTSVALESPGGQRNPSIALIAGMLSAVLIIALAVGLHLRNRV